VLGKGNRLRAIPLPVVCLPPLRTYRLARGLTPEPGAFERLPPIHSEKCDALGASGLYDEVKAVFHAAEERVAPGDRVTLALLRAASTHWLRHGYAVHIADVGGATRVRTNGADRLNGPSVLSKAAV
jgi:integrase/recombinase XerC